MTNQHKLGTKALRMTVYASRILVVTVSVLSVATQQPPETETDLSLEYLYTKYTQENTIEPTNASNILPHCEALVKEYGRQSSDFIKCSVENARPFRFCEGCVVHFKRTLTIYHDILESDESFDNCKYILLTSDRVQVINSVHEDILAIWENADCYKCFDPITEDDNGTVYFNLTQKTKDFLELYNNFTRCAPKYANGTIRNDTVCDTCRPYYRRMNDLFDELLNDKISPQHVCMDIVDMMNYTRLWWGDELQCTVTVKQRIPVIIVTCALLLIPVAFYVSIAFYGTKKKHTFMFQKRLSSMTASYGAYDNSHIMGSDSSSSGGSRPGSDTTERLLSITSPVYSRPNNIIPDPR